MNDVENQVVFYLDETLFKSKIINFHPLTNTTTITIKTTEFVNFIIEKGKKIPIFSLKSYSVVEVL